MKTGKRPHLTLEDQLFIIGLCAAVLILILFTVYRAWPESVTPFRWCVWDRLFHIYCPGCGGTRAVEALLAGEILRSLWLHPLVGYSVTIYFVFMISQLLRILSGGRIKGMRWHNWFLYAALMITVVNCLVKNVMRMAWNIAL